MSADPRRIDTVEDATQAIAAGDRLTDARWNTRDPTLRQLKVLAEIASLHQDALEGAQDPAATVGARPPLSVGKVLSRWDHFYLLEHIGEGTGGIVYRAWDSRLAREVALKLMLAAGSDGSMTLAEARRLARVRHPHFVTVLGVEQVDGQVGIWMELLKGQTLDALVRANGPLNAQEAALVGADVCSALAAVHRAGLLHRDVKAHNVVREHGGRVVLMDLGAGREIDHVTTELTGTPLYLAPELLAGGAATIASDLYGVGALLFFLTTGTLPVVAGTVGELKQAHREGRTRALRDERPDLPRPFIDVVDRALSPHSGRRFASAGDMERALTAVVAVRTGAGEAPSGVRALLGGKVPAWLTLILVAATAIGATLAGGWWSRAPRAPASVVDDGPPANPMRRLATDQLNLARAFESLAATHAAEGRWSAAVEQYREAEQVYRLNTSPDAPLVARARMHVAWAQYQAGDLAGAVANFELAIAKFRDFGVEPFISATQTALAGAHERAGAYAAAVTSIDGAIEARARTLSPTTAATARGLARMGVTPAQLVKLMPAWSIGQDQDEDWLPDLLEATVGLNPRARDSNDNGRPDSQEDHDGDGIANYLEFGLPLDPTAVIAHYGSNDPEWLAFEQSENRRTAGRASGTPEQPMWRVEGFGQMQLYTRLTEAQRKRALARGWRLSTRGHHGDGRAFTNLDLGPEGPRFDLDIEAAPGAAGLVLQRNTSVVPYEGLKDVVASGRSWPLVELEYDPAHARAQLLLDGLASPSPPSIGHPQFREQLGLFFGVVQSANHPAAGRADFQLVMFVIR